MATGTWYSKAGADSTFATQAALAAKADASALFSGAYGDLTGKPMLGTAAAQDVAAFATAAQGAKADSAVQPGALATVATSGSYNDLTNKPTISSGAYQWSPQVGSYWQLTRSSNGATKYTVGTEFAVGINLPAMSVDSVTITVTTAGASGSTMLVGLRPITGNPSTYGAPLFTAAFDTSATGSPAATISAAIPAGAYALTWCQSVDSAATAQVQYAAFDYNGSIFPLAQSTQAIATGHGPAVARLNTGVISTTALPSTVAIANDNTNQAGNNVPQIVIHRSA